MSFLQQVVVARATLFAFASYDNSTNNLANPDPNATVTWGEQSWDEMMLGYFDVAIPRDAAAKAAMAQIEGFIRPQDQARQLMTTLDKNGNGTIEADEVGARRRLIFDRVDKDRDGVVTLEELSAGMAELRGFLPNRKK